MGVSNGVMRRLAVWQEIGASILQSLHRQREQIQQSRSFLDSVDKNIAKSNSVLRKM